MNCGLEQPLLLIICTVCGGRIRATERARTQDGAKEGEMHIPGNSPHLPLSRTVSVLLVKIISSAYRRMMVVNSRENFSVNWTGAASRTSAPRQIRCSTTGWLNERFPATEGNRPHRGARRRHQRAAREVGGSVNAIRVRSLQQVYPDVNRGRRIAV